MVQQCEKHMYTQHGKGLSWCFCACKYVYPFYIAFRGRLGLNKGSTAASPRHNTTRRRLQTTHKCGPQCEGNLSRWSRVRKNLFLCCCRHRRHPHHPHHHHHNTYHHSPQCSSIIHSITNIIKLKSCLEHWVISLSHHECLSEGAMDQNEKAFQKQVEQRVVWRVAGLSHGGERGCWVTTCLFGGGSNECSKIIHKNQKNSLIGKQQFTYTIVSL